MQATFGSGVVNAGALRLAFGRTPDPYFDPVDAGTSNYRDVYWRLYVLNESGWTTGGGNSGNKLSRATVFAESSWAQAAIGHVWAMGSGEEFLGVDPASGTDAAGNLRTTKYNDFNNLRWLGSRTGDTPLFSTGGVGQWYCVEARMRLNDSGSSNGTLELWIDGNLDAAKTNLNFVGSYSDYGINSVMFENWWNAGSPKQQTRYFDNIVVSSSRIGCGDGS
jgi:hypothetical protein